MATSVELVLHPLRLRIVQAFLGGRVLTTTQLRAELPDIAAASLYRHVARLVNGGVLDVVAERRARGAVERSYVLREAVANRGVGAEFPGLSREEHRRAFAAFVAELLGEFDRYLAREDADPARDGVNYRLTGLWLSDPDLSRLQRAVSDLFEPYLANGPAPGRRRRILAGVLLPGEQRRFSTDNEEHATGVPETD